MEKTADAVVVGGGILGASTAHFLAKRGFGKVVLLEKRTLAAVSTGHSAAIVRTFYSNPLTIRLALRAIEMFQNDQEELGGDCSFRQVGYLCLLEEGTVSPGQQVAQVLRSNGVEVAELSPEDVQEMAPFLNLEGIVGGILEPRSGYADPVRTTYNVVERAKAWGLKVYEGVGATGLRLDGNRVTAVETDRGTIETRTVVNAAGPWGRQVGLWAGLNYSLRWSRECDAAYQLPSDFGPFPAITDPNLRFYFRPQEEGMLVVGLGWPKEVEPLDVDDYDRDLDPEHRRRIEEKMFQRVPATRYATYLHGWASIYTITDDWHPLVGPEPGLEGYFACFGGSGHCFKLGPPIGEALADVIAGDIPKIDIHPLRPSRFAEGETFSSAWGGGNRA